MTNTLVVKFNYFSNNRKFATTRPTRYEPPTTIDEQQYDMFEFWCMCGFKIYYPSHLLSTVSVFHCDRCNAEFKRMRAMRNTWHWLRVRPLTQCPRPRKSLVTWKKLPTENEALREQLQQNITTMTNAVSPAFQSLGAIIADAGKTLNNVMAQVKILDAYGFTSSQLGLPDAALPSSADEPST